jgi:hypothetical protein
MAASYLAAVVQVELVEERAQGHRIVLAAGELCELLRKVRATLKVRASSEGRGRAEERVRVRIRARVGVGSRSLPS